MCPIPDWICYHFGISSCSLEERDPNGDRTFYHGERVHRAFNCYAEVDSASGNLVRDQRPLRIEVQQPSLHHQHRLRGQPGLPYLGNHGSASDDTSLEVLGRQVPLVSNSSVRGFNRHSRCRHVPSKGRWFHKTARLGSLSEVSLVRLRMVTPTRASVTVQLSSSLRCRHNP